MISYVDNLLHIGFQPKEDMDALNFIFQLKESLSTPDCYLGTNVKNIQ